MTLALLCTWASAQDAGSPSRTFLIVPFTPGTGADVLARLLEEPLAQRLQQTVVVENKVGASGAIGTDYVAKARPDGHTLLVTATAHGTVPALKHDLPYDAQRSFTPVALLATSSLALVVTPEIAARNLAEFVMLARRQPGTLYYSSPGIGSPQHLAMELLKQETDIDVVHVPYKGSAGAASDLIGGQVQASIAALQTIAPFVRSGRLRMLAVLSDSRSPAFPDVPTAKEQGLPNLVVETWYGVFAPAGTPAATVTRLNAEFGVLLRKPETRAVLAQQGMRPVADRPERLGILLREELARWSRVVDVAHITVE